MNLRNKGITLSYVHLIVNMLSGLFLSSFLINQLGDTEYGIYQNISAFANYLLLLEFGTGTVMTRNIAICRGINSSEQKTKETVSTLWTVTNILAIIITLVSVVMYFSIDVIYAQSMTFESIQRAKFIFIFVTINLVISFYSQTFTGMTLAYEKYSYGPYLKTAKVIIRTIALAILIVLFKHSVVIALVDIVLSIFVLLISYIYCKKEFKLSFSFRYFNKEIFKSTLPYFAALFLQTLINLANNNVDKFIIGIFISTEAVTLYSISLFVFNIFSAVGNVPVTMYGPQIVKEISSGKSPALLIDKYIASSKLTAVICGSIFFGFVSVGKPFIKLLYGTEYMDAWTISILLMLPQLLILCIDVLVNVLDVLNKRLVLTLTLAGTTFANIALTLLLLNLYGYVGAAVATAICTSGQFVFLIFYYYKKIGINVFVILSSCFKTTFLPQLVAMIAGCFVSFIISYETTFLAILSLVAGGLVYVLTFASLFYAFNKEESKEYIKLLKKKLKKSA